MIISPEQFATRRAGGGEGRRHHLPKRMLVSRPPAVLTVSLRISAKIGKYSEIFPIRTILSHFCVKPSSKVATPVIGRSATANSVRSAATN
jgi:hypothetical protein